MAAGVAVEEKDVEKFKEVFEQTIQAQEKREVEIKIDAHLTEIHGVDQVLEFMEPVGNGNPAPLIRVKDFIVEDIRVMKEIHLKLRGHLKTQQRGRPLSVLQFKSPWVKMFSGLQGKKVLLDFCGELSQNEWQGIKSTEFVLKELLEVKDSGGRINIGRVENATSDQQSL